MDTVVKGTTKLLASSSSEKAPKKVFQWLRKSTARLLKKQDSNTSSSSSSSSSSFSGSIIEGVVWTDDWGTWHDDYYTLNEDEEINEVQLFSVFEPIDLTCELIQNLGYGFSEATWGHPPSNPRTG